MLSFIFKVLFLNTFFFKLIMNDFADSYFQWADFQKYKNINLLNKMFLF